MQCPKCQSLELLIKQNKGLERIESLWTGLRQYRCQACDAVFRAADRRKRQRADASADAVSRQPGWQHGNLH